MVATVFLAILVKNSLNWAAIIVGSLMCLPFMVKCEMSFCYFVVLCMAEKSIFQVFRKFCLFSSNCLSKYCFFALHYTAE